jgi:hypothetical protein
VAGVVIAINFMRWLEAAQEAVPSVSVICVGVLHCPAKAKVRASEVCW